MAEPFLSTNRYESTSPVDVGNNVKFHVGGCAYFWAVSEAFSVAKKSIWILGWWLSPEVYLRRPPFENEQYRLDRILLAAAQRGVKVNIVVYKEVPFFMCLNSKHTKTALEELHPDISVLRYPDHIWGPEDIVSAARSLIESATNSTPGAAAARLHNLSDDILQVMLGFLRKGTLLWTHHDKLVIVDQEVAFTGGLDLSFGRWDTIQHPIADAHAGNATRNIFPGQDYNNARIMDYSNLENWKISTLDRRTTPRLGWQDISVSLTGPSVLRLCQHFVHRWNYICNMKYNDTIPGKSQYELLSDPKSSLTVGRDIPDLMDCQLVRSVSNWSHGTPTENSIYHAYIGAIEKSEHFVYIENQFFITATANQLGAPWNRVAEALIGRILRAAEEKRRYKVFVVLPAVPAFPGDLQWVVAGQSSRALMQLQYESINRGGSSVCGRLREAGLDPAEYIRFFNLRSYDRINHDPPGQRAHSPRTMLDPLGMSALAGISGVRDADSAAYCQPRPEHEEVFGMNDVWDTVSSCYMLDGRNIQSAFWPPGDATPETDAFVCEEVYVHSKLLIVDDKVVICGSANLNDRSLKGGRDSELALVIEEKASLASLMHHRPFAASRFAATFRRYLFRQHLGLLSPQDMRKPDDNFKPAPAPNDYDYGSEWDTAVADPLSDEFLDLVDNVARHNTRAFWKVFAPVPDNSIRTWEQYERLYQQRFAGPDNLYITQWGHVLKDNFSAGEQGVKEVKEELSKIKGTLVEMPLEFLADEEIQDENLIYNIITRQGLS